VKRRWFGSSLAAILEGVAGSPLRVLDNKWIARVANAAFLIGAIQSGVRLVSGLSLNAVGVALLAIGVMLMAAHWVGRRSHGPKRLRGRSGGAAYGKGMVVHGANPDLPRPEGYASVEWQGSVKPTHARDNDRGSTRVKGKTGGGSNSPLLRSEDRRVAQREKIPVAVRHSPGALLAAENGGRPDRDRRELARSTDARPHSFDLDCVPEVGCDHR
jgi:hypothetical protein